ncbi:16S rRNA (uracil(1498)-N(3))-methyltransferase [Bulleidia sp. zg-1006]|uniref:RsmE family RNA methyltransferase n=1 Tax=Bulleidia sp. zg-1006 TaxID=2806552 RepID=UPI00193A6E36|nr:RsmE family RNA methyltransferase [Bulleidia sp. zg-1006]QRG86090.1 16S rRNA (uracil(1498)-N(3))-methyltransferase [Bulleidia sp. zg-1006]
MYQYFCQTKPEVDQIYTLSKEQEHHAHHVLRLNQELIRLVYEGKAYFAKAEVMNGKFQCYVEREDSCVNELEQNITLCMALIRKEKFEWILQKATELGVKRIVPFTSSRTIVKVQKEKEKKVRERYKQIVLAASQQCKRNCLPEVTEAVRLQDLKNYQSEENVVAYEAKKQDHSFFDLNSKKDTTIVIGAEGGFSLEEIQVLEEMGFQSISLGKRILRAETAAIFALSVLAMKEI